MSPTGSALHMHRVKWLATAPSRASLFGRGWHGHHSVDESKACSSRAIFAQYSHQFAPNQSPTAGEGWKAPNTWAGGSHPWAFRPRNLFQHNPTQGRQRGRPYFNSSIVHWSLGAPHRSSRAVISGKLRVTGHNIHSLWWPHCPLVAGRHRHWRDL